MMTLYKLNSSVRYHMGITNLILSLRNHKSNNHNADVISLMDSLDL